MAVRRSWRFDFPHSIEDVWRVFSDTDSFNRAAGLDFHFERDGDVMRGSTRVAGLGILWEERPIEWIAPGTFRSHRVYDQGPVAEAIAELELQTVGEQVVASYVVSLEPRWGVPTWLVRGLAWFSVWPGVQRALQRVEDVIRGDAVAVFEAQRLPDTEFRRLCAAVGGETMGNGLMNALCGRPIDGGVIRPKVVARALGFDTETVVLACLDGARAGVLELALNLLCPRCRGLLLHDRFADLEDGGHCSTCNLSFEMDLASGVEVVFRAHPSVGVPAYEPACIFSPARTPPRARPRPCRAVQLHTTRAWICSRGVSIGDGGRSALDRL